MVLLSAVATVDRIRFETGECLSGMKDGSGIRADGTALFVDLVVGGRLEC